MQQRHGRLLTSCTERTKADDLPDVELWAACTIARNAMARGEVAAFGSTRLSGVISLNYMSGSLLLSCLPCCGARGSCSCA